MVHVFESQFAPGDRVIIDCDKSIGGTASEQDAYAPDPFREW